MARATTATRWATTKAWDTNRTAKMAASTPLTHSKRSSDWTAETSWRAAPIHPVRA
jgi:hypothetical protein